MAFLGVSPCQHNCDFNPSSTPTSQSHGYPTALAGSFLTQQMSSVSGDSWQTHEGYGFRWSAIGISCFEASFTKLVGYLLGSQIETKQNILPKNSQEACYKGKAWVSSHAVFILDLQRAAFWRKNYGQKRSPLNRPFSHGFTMLALLCWFLSTGLQVIRENIYSLSK